jgi:hypothetical protein
MKLIPTQNWSQVVIWGKDINPNIGFQICYETHIDFLLLQNATE